MFININNFDSMPVDSSIDEVCGLLGVNGMNAAEYNTTVKFIDATTGFVDS